MLHRINAYLSPISYVNLIKKKPSYSIHTHKPLKQMTPIKNRG